MRKQIYFTVIILIAIAAGVFVGRNWSTNGIPTQGGSDGAERDILYWVAPMDPNFRRDEPGKSPMGMDLAPVYADEVGAR